MDRNIAKLDNLLAQVDARIEGLDETLTEVYRVNSTRKSIGDYEIYHNSYTSAINEAFAYAKKRGYEIDETDAYNEIGFGPKKPSEGMTNKFSIPLYKDGKLQKKALQIQVYGMRTQYELNVYIL